MGIDKEIVVGTAGVLLHFRLNAQRVVKLTRLRINPMQMNMCRDASIIRRKGWNWQNRSHLDSPNSSSLKDWTLPNVLMNRLQNFVFRYLIIKTISLQCQTTTHMTFWLPSLSTRQISPIGIQTIVTSLKDSRGLPRVNNQTTLEVLPNFNSTNNIAN